MAQVIPLSKGYFTIVDDEDVYLKDVKWHAQATTRKDGSVLVYARRTVFVNGKKKAEFLHQRIVPNVPEVDHRDGDGLNNRRGNLRAATRLQNSQNCRKPVSKYRFKGVAMRSSGKWQAATQKDGKYVYIGSFDSEVEAASAYNKVAKELFGEFYRGNPIP